MKQTEKAISGGMDKPSPAGAGNTGTKTEDIKNLDENALNEPELISSVEDRLRNLDDISRPERGTRKNPAAEVEDDEDEPEVDDEESDTSDEPPESGPSDADSPTLDDKGLPEAYVRAAVAYGWKQEDALEFYKASPERALTTFSNIYQTRNRASAEFAAIGRKAREQPAQDKGEEKPPFEPVDAVKLREKYGEEAEPLIAMLEAQNKTLNQLASQLPRAPKDKMEPLQSAVEESGVEQQIHQYFESDAMKPWQKVYGKLEFGQTWEDLPAGAREHRYRLLTVADQIAGGATLQGTKVSLPEALDMAHLLVTQKYRDEVLIDGIKGKVVQRSKSLTLKPSKGTKKPGKEVTEAVKPGTRTKEQLVGDTERKLRKLFGG